MAMEDELKKARQAKAEALVAAGVSPFPNDFRAGDEENHLRDALARIAADEAACAELPEEPEVTAESTRYPLFGRVMAKRGPFLVIRTPGGDVQALVRKDKLPEADAAQLAQVDMADHVWVTGPAIRTRSGALAVSAERYGHISKSMLPPPGKWHGLKDVEKRYRERYVDLFANPDVAKVFRARSTIVRALRDFLDTRAFLEVETPLLHAVRGGASAKPFKTHHNALDIGLNLRIAPELYLKRLLVGGFDRVYEIGRAFRNEGISTRHNPEFTILEFYMAYATMDELLDLTVALFRHVDAKLREQHPALCEERAFDLDAEWARVPMVQSIVDRIARSGDLGATPWDDLITADVLADASALEAAFATASETVDKVTKKQLGAARNHGERIFLLYELVAEPDLPKMYRTEDGERSLPVFIVDYPFEVSPLARRNDENPAFTDRFELFIEGREVANAFSELNDPDDQAARFRDQLEKAAAGDDEAMEFDADYIRALSHGMPPAAGFGLGVDRLVMTLCNQPSIRDVLLFPLLRPEAG